MKAADFAVHMSDGVVHRQSSNVGMPADDLDQQWRKLAAECQSCAAPVIGSEIADQLTEAVRTIDQAEYVHELMALCGP